MAARLHSKTLSAAALAAAIAPTLFGSSMADRRAMDLGSGKMAMVVQHRHLQHVALAPAVAEESRARRSPNRRNGTERDVSEPRWPGQNGTLALEVERLNRTILDVPNETAMEEMVEREIERMIDSKQTVGNKTLLVMRDSSAVHQVWRKVDQRVRASRLKAAMRLCAIGRAPGGARALLPAVPGVALALERDADKRVRTRALTVLGLAGPELVERKATVVMQVLQAAMEDKEAAKEVRVAALEALPQLLRHEDAAQAVPVILQAATEDTEGKVRAAGVDALARLVGPLAIEQAADALLVAAANDTEPLVRETALNHLPMLGPRSAKRSVAVALRAVADEKDKEVRLVALKVLPMLGGIGAAEQTMINLSRTLTDRPDCSNCWSKERTVRIHKTFVTLTRLSDLFWRLEPAALKPLVPTLVVVLRESLPYLSLSMISGNAHVPAKEVAVMVGRALAKVASAAGTDVLNLLNKAEHEPDVDDTYKLSIRLSRETVQEALEAKCRGSFLRDAGIVTSVENLTADIPFGIMLASDASTNSTQAYKCPNPYSCAMPRHQMMRPSLTSSTGFKEGACPFLLVAPLVTSNGIPDEGSSMCATGIDASSLGCTKCAKDFGRKDTDPFSCEPCGKLDSAMKWWAAWLAQPMILFLLSMRSAENAAASRGMAAALANDVVKIVLAYLSSISVVVSSVTSTDAYRELNAADRARQTLRLTRQTAQRGDVTYSSSSDCLLMDGQGAASVNQLVALSLQKPACVLAVAAALIAIRACGRAAFSGSTLDLKELRAEVLNSLVTCSLVAGNQFLPGVAAAGMRALPCFHMQTAFDGEGPLQFMAYDPDTACRAHTRYLATCGPALAFAFAAGPAYWMTLLRRWQGAQQGGPLRFLTGSYRAGFHWWESGRLSKTMLIACVVTASPKSYCPLQQLQLCLLVTVAYGFWHCFNRPYKHLVLNVAEAGSLFTLSVGMVLSGVLAGGGWSLTPGFRSSIITSIAAVLLLYLLGLAGLWVKVRFFWSEAPDAEALDEGAPGLAERLVG